MPLLRRTACLCVFLLLVASAALAQQHHGFYLHDGDRVVFYGDSITDQRLYTVFTEAYVVTRFPRMNVKFVHSGWGGDRVSGGGGGPIDLRLKRDVIAYNPTVMTVMLGMNDAGYRPFDQGLFDTYVAGLQHIIDTVKSALPGIRITLIQPSPFDDVTRAPGFPGGYNAVLIRYGEAVRDLARKNNLDVADLNTSVVAALEKAKALDTTQPPPGQMPMAQRLVPDRVHPSAGGHLLMTAALLRAWHAPAIVSDTEIDTGKKTIHVDNGRSAALSIGPQAVSWQSLDNALPMPIDFGDGPTQLALRASDVVQTLDEQPLKVTGLTAARYTLKVDGQDVGTFTREQLADGINLAELPTPMLKQAMDVLALTRLHNDVHFTRWRVVQVPHQTELQPYYQAAMDALDHADADIVRQQRAAAQPKPHRFELVAE